MILVKKLKIKKFVYKGISRRILEDTLQWCFEKFDKKSIFL
jgi:hypothetical protein